MSTSALRGEKRAVTLIRSLRSLMTR
jgi:hypothetical protein